MKYLKIVLLGLIFIGAVFLGFCIKNYPLIKFNPELKVYEVLNLLLTASIGIFIPFFIKKWIEDSRQIKNNLVEEIKDFIREIEKIDDKIKFCYSRRAIYQTDKEELNFMFDQSDIQFTMLDQLFSSAYESETKVIRAQLKEFYLGYWKFVTGGELMTSRFLVISEDFFRRNNESYMKMEVLLKQLINKVHKL